MGPFNHKISKKWTYSHQKVSLSWKIWSLKNFVIKLSLRSFDLDHCVIGRRGQKIPKQWDFQKRGDLLKLNAVVLGKIGRKRTFVMCSPSLPQKAAENEKKNVFSWISQKRKRGKALEAVPNWWGSLDCCGGQMNEKLVAWHICKMALQLWGGVHFRGEMSH